MIVYLARDIPAFVMYCVYRESRSSLLIESTDSMMIYTDSEIIVSTRSGSLRLTAIRLDSALSSKLIII